MGNDFNHNIRLNYECRIEIDIYIQRITVLNHEACRVIRNGDPEGGFLSNHFRRFTYPDVNLKRMHQLYTDIYCMYWRMT